MCFAFANHTDATSKLALLTFNFEVSFLVFPCHCVVLLAVVVIVCDFCLTGDLLVTRVLFYLVFSIVLSWLLKKGTGRSHA